MRRENTVVASYKSPFQTQIPASLWGTSSEGPMLSVSGGRIGQPQRSSIVTKPLSYSMWGH